VTPVADDRNLGHSAWNAFEAGDFALARERFRRLVVQAPDDLDAVSALHQLYIDQERWSDAVELLAATIERMEPVWDPREQLPWRTALFEAAVRVEPSERVADLAAAVFEAAAAGGTDLWDRLLSGKQRAEIEPLLAHAETAMPVLEQWLFAPEATGLRGEALARIEAIGSGYGADPGSVRAAERLLHAAGEREAAYRVERAHESSSPAHPRTSSTADTPAARGLDLTLVGGHPALRSMSRRDLLGDGARNVREIPSAWEGARVERSIVATMSGSDLAVVIARQVAHATSDQVRKVGHRIGVPIEIAQAASVGSIRKAVERFSAARPHS
jgi:hypothetical protein